MISFCTISQLNSRGFRLRFVGQGQENRRQKTYGINLRSIDLVLSTTAPLEGVRGVESNAKLD
jgi:hypothetical protein